MNYSCPICRQECAITSGVSCILCKGLFHPTCLKMKSSDAEFIRDQANDWKCPECVHSGRRLRSKSATTKPAVQDSSSGLSLSGDQITRLFSELAGIKSAQTSIVEEMARIKNSQDVLSSEIHSKYNSLQETLTQFGVQMSEHAELISKHAGSISVIEERLSETEAEIRKITDGL